MRWIHLLTPTPKGAALAAALGAAMVLTVASAQQPDVPARERLSDIPAVPSEEAQQLLDMTNQARDSQGLGPLRWDPALSAAAGQHTQLMRGQPELSHAYPGEPTLLERASKAGAHFASIAENIAVGPSPAAIEREWLHSAPHRANIFDPRMNAIGIAVERRGGDYYATEDFAQTVSSVTPEQAETQVAMLIRQQGIAVHVGEAAVREARETCEMSTESAGGEQPGFIIRWESPALNVLPAPLVQRIATGQYKSAVVGSCTSMHPQQSFTTYRVAVLLF